MVTLLALGVIAASALFGYRKGASRIAGSLLAIFLAILLAPPFGRAIEGMVAGIIGTGGVLNRLISIAFAGALILISSGYLCSLAIAKLVKLHAQDEAKWRRIDKSVGLGLGAAEGLLMVMILGWTALALDPVAAARLASDQTGADAPNQVATRVRQAAAAIRDSLLGSAIQATLPNTGSDLMGLAADFAAISRDRAALDYFTSTPVMKEINDLPSVRDARKAFESDPALRATFSERGIDAQGIRRILESNTLLDILDRTSIASDFAPLISDLKAAIAEAKRRIKPPDRAPETPAKTR